MKSLFKKGIKTKAKNYEPIQGLTNCTHGDKRVHNEIITCIKVCAGKSIKTHLGSTLMLFKIVSYVCMCMYVIFISSQCFSVYKSTFQK